MILVTRLFIFIFQLPPLQSLRIWKNAPSQLFFVRQYHLLPVSISEGVLFITTFLILFPDYQIAILVMSPFLGCQTFLRRNHINGRGLLVPNIFYPVGYISPKLNTLFFTQDIFFIIKGELNGAIQDLKALYAPMSS